MSDQKIKYRCKIQKSIPASSVWWRTKYQDIVWIGWTDKGYMYFNDAFITNTLLDTPVYWINNPVRTVTTTRNKPYDREPKERYITYQELFSETNAAVSFDRISISNSTNRQHRLLLCPGSWNRLWIGTENGLNYYSYQNKQLKAFWWADGKKVKYVHSINELNDTLWVSTVGEGIVKVILDKAGSSPSVKSLPELFWMTGVWLQLFLYSPSRRMILSLVR